jgi:hypothetical protein
MAARNLEQPDNEVDDRRGDAPKAWAARPPRRTG